MSHVDLTLIGSGQVHRTSAPSASDARAKDGEKPDSAWTVVDVDEPEENTDDDDRSLVEISRASSPLMVQFGRLDLADHPQVHISWPSNLPWFQFQDRFFHDMVARELFTKQFQLASSAVGRDSAARMSMVVPSRQQSLTTRTGFNHAVSRVSRIMPEQFDGENATRVKALIGTDALEAKLQEFQLFAYQLSNNLIQDEDDEYMDDCAEHTKIIEIFRGIGLPRSMWTDLIVQSHEQPTGRAFTEALFAAAVNNQSLDVCEALLEAGADPDQVIWTCASMDLERPIQLAMHWCVRNTDLAKLLIRFGADVNLVTGENPEPALQKAAKECTCEAVRVLVEAGATMTDQVFMNAVEADWRMSCIRDEEEEDELQKSGEERLGLLTLRYLLTLHDRDRHQDLIQDGLVRAASQNRRDMIEDLLQAGACINKASRKGLTPLIAAVAGSYQGRSARMVKMLLELGADVGVAFQDTGIRALHIAAAKGDEKAVKILIDRGADVNALASFHTRRQRSLLGLDIDPEGMAPIRLREINTCQRPLRFALFKNRPREYQLTQKTGSAALALIRAGATLEGGELALAGCFDDVDLLRELQSSGADVNEVDTTGRSALQACLEFENFDLVAYLLESGATSNQGHLISAIRGGRGDIVEILIDHGVDFEDQGTGSTLVQAAASSKNWELMTWLMETHDVPYDEVALCTAVCSGLGNSQENEKYLISLLKRRTDRAVGGILEATALGYAAFHRQDWVLQHLLQLQTKGPCLIPVKDSMEYHHVVSARVGYISRGYEKPFWLDPAMTRCSILVPALLCRGWQTVRQLLRAGHEPDRLSLLVAVKIQPLKTIAKLASRMDKLDICQPAQSGLDTPLQAAARHRRIDVVRYLLGQGVDVNAPASERLIVPSDWFDSVLPRTALQAAVENGHEEMIDLLLDAGADVNGPAGWDAGATALQIAAGTGQIGLARRLIGLGANVNAKRAKWSGRTALEAAAEWGRLDMVQFLLGEGAGVGSRGIYKQQYEIAVMLAENRGHGAVAKIVRTSRSQIVAVWEDEESESEESWYTSEDEDDYDYRVDCEGYD